MVRPVIASPYALLLFLVGASIQWDCPTPVGILISTTWVRGLVCAVFRARPPMRSFSDPTLLLAVLPTLIWWDTCEGQWIGAAIIRRMSSCLYCLKG